MRELKFKFWNKIARTYKRSWRNAICNDGKFITWEPECASYSDPIEFSRSIIVAQQFTGLKDKNDKEIYEGDIIKYTFDGASYPKEAVDKILICEWDQSNAWFVFKEHDDNISDGYYWLEIKGYCEVIGNIFENNDLLKQ